MLLVFGSINVDLIFPLPTLPRPGETVLGDDYRIAAGGKGANQAVAAARDGARVAMAGAVGRDSFAAIGLHDLREAGIDLALVLPSAKPTGCAAVAVDAKGENLIAVASGANAAAGAADIPDAMLGRDTTVLMQMEVPPRENADLVARARARGARTMLNLAPAAPLDDTTLAALDVLIVNEIEAAWLAKSRGLGVAAPDAIARALARHWHNTVVLTLGGEGAIAARADETWRVGVLDITPIDTTGAGDAFVGVLAGALDRGAALPDALRRASVAAGLACLVRGAQPSLARASAIDARLNELAPPTRLA
jgi:ribokinase